jgi:hypothetical protein
LTDIAIIAYQMGGIGVYLANGDGTFRAGWYDQTGTDWSSWPGARVTTADFVGNGKSGILVSAYGLGGIGSYGPNSALPDLVTSIDNGLALVPNITYQPATNGTVYTKTSGATFPVVDIQTPIYLVSSAATSNGIGGGTVTTNYKYIGARTHLQARSLGFGMVEATDAQGIKTATTFRQDFPYQGLPTQSVKTQPSGLVISRVDNTWTDTLLAPAPGSGGKYHKSALTQSIERSYELSGALITTITTTTVYDGFGNATSIAVSTGDGFSKSTTNTYTNDTANWFLGRLIRSQVTSTTP